MMQDFTNQDVFKSKSTKDIRGNINSKILPLFSSQNNKGMTPLNSAIDAQEREIALFLIDVMCHLQETQGKVQVLTQSIDLQDIKSETALIKAIRTQ